MKRYKSHYLAAGLALALCLGGLPLAQASPAGAAAQGQKAALAAADCEGFVWRLDSPDQAQLTLDSQSTSEHCDERTKCQQVMNLKRDNDSDQRSQHSE